MGRWEEKIMCGALLFLSIFILDDGMPTISSSIVQLSRELCPGRVTFSCNSLQTGSPIIDWYINDTRLVRYEYAPSHMFPYLVDTLLPGLMAQITSADFHTELYNFMNFTLSDDLNNIIQYRGQKLTCGTVLKRSTSIDIGNFTIRDVTLNDDLEVKYTAYYNYKQELTNISLQWIDETEVLNCSITISYLVEIEYNGSVIDNHSINSMACKNKCFVNFYNVETFQLNTTSISEYVVSVYRVYTAFQEVSSTILFTSGKSIFESIQQEDECQPYIKCSSLSMTNCNISYGYDSNYDKLDNNITLAPNTTHKLEENVLLQNMVYVEVDIFTNMTILILRFNLSAPLVTSKSDVAYLVVGCIALGIATVMIILGFCYCARLTFFLQSNCHALILITAFHFVTSGICIISWILWITYSITYTQDFCGKNIHHNQLAISAMASSLLGLIVSIMSSTGFCIIKVTRNGEKPQPLEEVQMTRISEIQNDDLTFGIKFEGLTDNRKCIDCDGVILFAVLCKSCTKNMCQKCGGKFKAYVPRLNEIHLICKSCNKLYWKENYKLAKRKFFVVNEDSQSNVKECAVCKQEVQLLMICPFCAKKVCKKDFDDIPEIENRIFQLEQDTIMFKKCCRHCHELISRKYHLIRRSVEQYQIEQETVF